MDAETLLILDIAILLGAAGILSIIFGKLKMPTIIGYLAGGVILGSIAIPGFIMDQSALDMFSTLGIILLMFFIGIELNLKGLRKTGAASFLIVAIEMSLMVLTGYYFGRLIGLSQEQAIFIGAIISGASTAAVLAVAKDNVHMKGDLSKTVMSIMVFEDIAQIIILTLASPLASGTGIRPDNTYWIILEIIAFMGLSILIGLAIMPKALDWLRKNYSRETVLIVSLAICFIMAFLSGYIGLSVAIGAFMAGLIISESTCSNIVRRRIEPMKEVFIAIFFFSIGLQINLGSVYNNILLCIGIAAVFITAKLLNILFASYLTTMDLRSSFYIATSLVAMSEFGFIIATLALQSNIINDAMFSTIIGAALITMVALPLLSRHGPRIYDRASVKSPLRIKRLVGRMERIREEVSRKLIISPELRLEVQRQLLLVFVDFIVIISILIVFNLVSYVKDLLVPLADQIHVLPSLLLFVMTLVLISPVVVNIITRLRFIAFVITMEISEGGRHSLTGRMRTYRIYRNVGTILVTVILFFVLVPFLPPLNALDPTAVVGLAAIIALLSVLSWGVMRPIMNRASVYLASRVVMIETNDEEVLERMVCED